MKLSLRTPQSWRRWNDQIIDWWEEEGLIWAEGIDQDVVTLTSRRTGYRLRFWLTTNRAQYLFKGDAPVFFVPCLDHYLKSKFA